MSTDKAVKPSSVMGATKRLAEIIVTSFAKSGATRFMAVRFGNVLNSSGSLPIFQEQLRRGGPLTVSDPEVKRFCMTVEPGKDVEIRFTGLRQGEKLDEELMEDPAGCSPCEAPTRRGWCGACASSCRPSSPRRRIRP